MNEVLKKSTYKCVPIVITPKIRQEIKMFKENLEDIRDTPYKSSEFDARTIDIILNELDDYDRNLIIAYYAIGECSYAKLSRAIGISQPVLFRKLNLIHEKIKEINDTPKSAHNKPRGCSDN